MQAPPRKLAFFQFRLQSLFIFTLIVAIISWLITVVPPGLWFILAFPTLPIVELTACILGIIYLSAARRAFFLGFMISLVQAMVFGFFAFHDYIIRVGGLMRDWEFLLLMPVFIIVIPLATGFSGVSFYWLRQKDKTPAAVPAADKFAAGGERLAVEHPHPETGTDTD